MTESPERVERIPKMLQHVFLSSNRGKDVTKAPPGQVASKSFSRSWTFFRGRNKEIAEAGESTRQKRSFLGSSLKKKAAPTPEKPRGPQPVPVAPLEKTSSPEQALVKPPPAAAIKVKEVPPPEDEATLQEYFDALLKERGYKVSTYDTLQTGYDTTASPLQIASHGPHMLQLIRSGDVEQLTEHLKVGLHPNPCNQFSESLLHNVCRRGDIDMVDVLLSHGASLQVCDDYGRTPLHDAFWAPRPCFDVVKRILDKDKGMIFLKDKRGSLPLSYVRKEDWPAWREWFDSKVDEYFPESQAGDFRGPELADAEPNSISVAEPKTIGVPLDLVKMVAAGSMTPREAHTVMHGLHQEDATEYESESEWDDSDYDSDEESVYGDLDQEEMMEILQFSQMSGPRA